MGVPHDEDSLLSHVVRFPREEPCFLVRERTRVLVPNTGHGVRHLCPHDMSRDVPSSYEGRVLGPPESRTRAYTHHPEEEGVGDG